MFAPVALMCSQWKILPPALARLYFVFRSIGRKINVTINLSFLIFISIKYSSSFIVVAHNACIFTVCIYYFGKLYLF